MSQIQNSCLSKQALLPPFVFMGAALLAGKYAIKYFPGASKEGLLMAASLASTTSYLYDTALYDIDHGYIRTLLGKATAIAFATLCTGLAAKSLEGRANISWEAAGKLAGVEFVLAAVISFATGESAVQKEYRHYHEYPYSWEKLSKKERTEKALKFMEAGLPAIIFGDVKKSKFPDPQTNEAWEALTPSQLSWTVSAREDDLNTETKVFLYELMQKRGIEPLRFRVDSEEKYYLEGKQERIDLLYQDMVRNPQFFWIHDKAGQKELSELFGQREIPPLDLKLKPLQITRMDGMLALIWGIAIKKQWEEVSAEARSAFVKRFWSLCNDIKNFDDACFTGIDISWLVQLSVGEIQALTVWPLRTCHTVMRINKEAVIDQLSPDQLSEFNSCFAHYHGLGEVK